MKKTDLAYVAGIVDGEGSISLINVGHNPKRTMTVVVQVANTNEWLVQWLRFSFGGWVTTAKRTEVQAQKWKPCYQWRVTALLAFDFLKLITPYLRLKKPQAEIALQFLEMRGAAHKKLTPAQHAISEAQKIVMGDLNQRGIK